MNVNEPGRVLSIQSHVVSGYVGNRAATFPLQLLGYDVDVINTVHFSNHTGYGHTNGSKTTPEQLSAIFEGLHTNGLTKYSRILTGYVPSAAALTVIADEIEDLKRDNPELIYVLDPVMGDIGTGLYVAPDVVPVYKSMLKLATVITPNQFEVELLSGVTVTSLPSLRDALISLHREHSLPHIAFSSIAMSADLVQGLHLPTPPKSYNRLLPDPLPPWYETAESGGSDHKVLVCFASSWTKGDIETWGFALPTIRGYFSGVGDLFSAMVLANFNSTSGSRPSTLAYAVSKALLTVQQILLRTHLHSISQSGSSGSATPRPIQPTHTLSLDSIIPSDSELDSIVPHPGDPKRKAKRMRIRELRLVQERDLIDNGEEGWPGKQLDWTSIQ